MGFNNTDSLIQAMRSLGAVNLLCKPLAENDNTKQQIYLGGSYEVLKQLPFSEMRSEPGVKRQNFKASLNFFWINENAQMEQATGAQLILYPDYPEVRLSGFLRGCSIAPSALLQPVPKEARLHNNGSDGRYLFLGVTAENKILAYLSPTGSTISAEMTKRIQDGHCKLNGVLYLIPNTNQIDSRTILLARLREIHQAGLHQSKRLDKQGIAIPYKAQNGGGYTLEALLGIKPNSQAAPDFMGWEVKAYSGSRITLMTPEPDSGYYGENGAEAFIRKYGRQLDGDRMYFTGTHKVGSSCASSGQTLLLTGFNSGSSKIVDVDGGIRLTDTQGNISASWSFNELIAHWCRKHAQAVYVPYKKSPEIPPEYHYKSPVLLGEETEFSLFLSAMERGDVVFDPASKVEYASTPKSQVKARSQFRVTLKKLPKLYKKFEAVDVD
jgi:MvaI/BcnI restriction endonuclease family